MTSRWSFNVVVSSVLTAAILISCVDVPRAERTPPVSDVLTQALSLDTNSAVHRLLGAFHSWGPRSALHVQAKESDPDLAPFAPKRAVRKQVLQAFDTFPEWTAQTVALIGNHTDGLLQWFDRDGHFRWNAFMSAHPMPIDIYLTDVPSVWNAQRWLSLVKPPKSRVRLVARDELIGALAQEQFPGYAKALIKNTPPKMLPDGLRVTFDAEPRMESDRLSVPIDGLSHAGLPAGATIEHRTSLRERLRVENSFLPIVALYGLPDSESRQIASVLSTADPSVRPLVHWLIIPGLFSRTVHRPHWPHLKIR